MGLNDQYTLETQKQTIFVTVWTKDERFSKTIER